MLTMLENKKFSSVVKLARTLHCEPTKLVAFILDNPKLFHTSNRWEPKKKKVPVIGRNYTPFGIAKGKAVIKALKPKLCIVFVSKRILLINLKHKQYDS